MPRWLRVIRGMIGTGLTFAAGTGVVAATIGALVWLGHGITGVELMQIAGKLSVVAFLLGIAFSGVLAITAGGRQFSKLSLRLVSGLGAGAGLVYFAFLAFNGGRNWSTPDAISNLLLLPLMGAGAAAATLMIARRTGTSLKAGEPLRHLGEGDAEILHPKSGSKIEVPRR